MAFYDTTNEQETALAGNLKINDILDNISAELEDNETFTEEMINEGGSEEEPKFRLAVSTDGGDGKVESLQFQIPEVEEIRKHLSRGESTEDSQLIHDDADEEEDSEIVPRRRRRRRSTERPLRHIVLVTQHDAKLLTILERNDEIVRMLTARWVRREIRSNSTACSEEDEASKHENSEERASDTDEECRDKDARSTGHNSEEANAEDEEGDSEMKDASDADIEADSLASEESMTEEEEDGLYHKCEWESRAITTWFETRTRKTASMA